ARFLRYFPAARRASITFRWNLWRLAPHAATKHLRVRFGPLELVEPRQWEARRHAGEARTHERRVHELTVLGEHVREVPVVRVERLRILLEVHPPMQDEPRQPIARLPAERCRRVEPTADLGRVDAEQPNVPVDSDIDRIAV